MTLTFHPMTLTFNTEEGMYKYITSAKYYLCTLHRTKDIVISSKFRNISHMTLTFDLMISGIVSMKRECETLYIFDI